MGHDTIAVLDFGGQYAHLIASKLRRIGVHSVIKDPTDPTDQFLDFKGIVLSGSPALKSKGELNDWNIALFSLSIPILGLCFGHQEMAIHYGGKVVHVQREYGPASLVLSEDAGKPGDIFEGLNKEERVFMSHGDSVVVLPEGFVELGYTTNANGTPHHFAAIADPKRKRYGFQFHCEVDDTLNGQRMLQNFAINICKCVPTWDMAHFLADERVRIQKKCEGKEVFLLISGGVDSTVCAWLLHEVLGPERLHLLHIDNGFMRLNESEKVLAALKEHDVSRHVHFSDSSEVFLKAVGQEVAPEKKRLIIGNTFIDVFQAEAKKLGLERFLLAQGTIYPDTIESGGTKRADVIKTHHNRVPIIQQMIEKGQVIEPIAELYKVEVRELGASLGVPEDFINRHPFPGPGLGVRLLCSTGIPPSTYNAAALTAAANPVAQRFGLSVLPLPIQSVGVKADLRCYDLPLMLHAAKWDWEGASKAAVDIFKIVPQVNRCVLYMGSRVPVAAHTLKAHTTRARLDTLRVADHAVMAGLKRHGLYNSIWQCPTVLVPVSIDYDPKDGKPAKVEGELVVIRPILSERAMTAMPANLPVKLIQELVAEIGAIQGVCCVALDVTPKPPGTIEWE